MSGRVWVVASEATGVRWARTLDQAGYDATAMAWSRVVGVDAERALASALAEGRPDRVLLTSRHGVVHRPATLPRDVPCACVGEATASAAREAGLAVQEVGPGTGRELADRLLDAEPRPALVLFLRGRDIRREGVERLQAGGVRVLEVVVYETRPQEDFEARLRAAPAPDALVVGSPRAAAALAEALVAAGRREAFALPVVAPGAPTAEALREAGFQAVGEAASPTPAGLLASLDAFLRNGPSRGA